MKFIAAGLIVFAGAIVIGLAYHNTLALGWQDISGVLPKVSGATGGKGSSPQ